MNKQAALPIVNQKLCKKCGICIKICPRKVLEPDADGLPCAVRPEKCTACDHCASHCPDFAIAVRPVQDTGLTGSGNTK